MWTKYSYVCTSCDALIEITTQVKPSFDPACICDYQTFVVRTAEVRDHPYDKEWEDMKDRVFETVTNITPTQLVKINTNPYN